MVLTNNTLVAFQENAFFETNKRLFRSLKNVFPEVIDQLPEEDWLEYIRYQRMSCNKHRIYTDRGILGYLMIGFLIGTDFYTNPAFLNLFDGADVSGDLEMDMFFEKLIETSV
jgi:hypothetical protein